MNTVRKTMAILVLMVVGVQTFGCTVPDDENYQTVLTSIGDVPPDIAVQVKRTEGAHRVIDWFLKELGQQYPYGKQAVGPDGMPAPGTDEIFLEVTCTGAEQPMTFGWTVSDVLGCVGMYKGNPLGGVPHKGPTGFKVVRTFWECIRGLTSRSEDLYQSVHDADDTKCLPKITKDWSHAPINDWKVESIDDDDLARALIQSPTPPPWAVAIGIVVVNGVVVIGRAAIVVVVALCALDNKSYCPWHPLYPGQERPMPDHGGQP